MNKERTAKFTTLFIIIAFILGAVVGYVVHDLTRTEGYQFEVGENILQNSGFEEELEGSPSYWYMAISPADNLTMSWDSEIQYNGSKSVGINNTHIYDEVVCNNWAQTIERTPIGRTVELSGWVKTIDVENVVMVIQCWDKNSNMIGFGTTQSTTNITGTTDWQMYKASVSVPANTNRIIVRLTLTGTGQVWFDDVELIVK